MDGTRIFRMLYSCRFILISYAKWLYFFYTKMQEEVAKFHKGSITDLEKSHNQLRHLLKSVFIRDCAASV